MFLVLPTRRTNWLRTSNGQSPTSSSRTMKWRMTLQKRTRSQSEEAVDSTQGESRQMWREVRRGAEVVAGFVGERSWDWPVGLSLSVELSQPWTRKRHGSARLAKQNHPFTDSESRRRPSGPIPLLPQPTTIRCHTSIHLGGFGNTVIIRTIC